MSTELKGIVMAVLIAPQAGSFLTNRQPSVEVTQEGLIGDQRHFGITFPSNSRQQRYPRGTIIRNFRQASILSNEELRLTAAEIGVEGLAPEWYGANLLVEGIPNLTLLPPSSRLLFSQGCTLVVDSENLPCGYVAQAVRDHLPAPSLTDTAFIRASLHRRGVVAWVERAGIIAVGDGVSVLLPDQPPYPLAIP